MTDYFAAYAALRAKYPDDVAQIEAEENRVAGLLKRQEFASLDVTQELLASCRRDIIMAQRRLANERHLTDEERNDLWIIVEARQWFVRMVAVDFEAELQQIGIDLEAELSR